MSIDQQALDAIALSHSEYELILARLGRAPNEVELGMFGALWSEHCGYKNSRPLLKRFPSQGKGVLTERGVENAGAVEIGDGYCVVMKIESHNHPSAIEPYQGAATGVGGIVRDIFAMGARPIAILDSLRFGNLSEKGQSYLFTGVVEGIGGYGNCLGVPTVGGEVYFEDAYASNPLVNAMCVGLARTGRLVSSSAEGVGNMIMLVGSDTGRDGIHGASGLASTTDPSRRFDELRPAVQVGNPFLEKMLMEACLDLAENHREWFTGIQDLGAAGLSSACVEAVARAGTGAVIDVARVPRRQAGMTPYEVMLSESQERMLITVQRGYERHVSALFDRWEVPWAIIGRVTNDGMVRINDDGADVAVLPVEILTEPPQYVRDPVRPEYLDTLQEWGLSALPDISDANAALLSLLASPNLASKAWVFRQYDHQLFTNTIIGPGADATLLRVKGTAKAISLTTDGNGRYCYLDPYHGGAIAVAEAARNVICTGALPVAVTDCLNFGDPERPEVYYQMEQVIEGISAACEKLGLPVISGNVSLYNETGGHAVYPTPVIGALGILDDAAMRCQSYFQQEGDHVFLLGGALEGRTDFLGGSEFLGLVHGLVAGRPTIDLDYEARTQKTALRAIEEGLLSSCHDCSDGGLAVALAECCLGLGLGLDAQEVRFAGRMDAALFGEVQSRFVVSCRTEARRRLEQRALDERIPLVYLGQVKGKRLQLGAQLDVSLDDLSDAYERALSQALRDGGD